MKEKLFYSLVVFFLYILLAIFIKDTGSAMAIMLFYIPVMVFIASLFYGYKKGFDYQIMIIAMLVFLPIVYGFLNSSALIYAFIYGVIALIANFVGELLRKLVASAKRKG